MREKCLFCDDPPGSREHVFLSALGGRLVSRHATCKTCNTHFASDAGGKIDDLLCKQFLHVRCGLAIWGGRDDPPPAIPQAGTFPDGGEFDLAPGFVPVLRAPRIPDGLKPGSEFHVSTRNVEEAKRIKEILKARGLNPEVKNAERVRRKAPMVHFKLSLGGQVGLRSAGKTAVIGACVLYGNEKARRLVDPAVIDAIHHGCPDIANFAEWDYANEWPLPIAMRPYKNAPEAQTSGFEHTLVIGDVQDISVAYIEFFGGIRFSIKLGRRSGLTPRGLALNPRAMKSSRFVLTPEMPLQYNERNPASLKAEFDASCKGLNTAFNNIFQQWQSDSHKQYYDELADKLEDRLMSAGDDEAAREAVFRQWTEEVTLIEFGGSWREDLDVADFDDDPPG